MRILLPLWFFLILGLGPASAGHASVLEDGKAVIYYNETCHGCPEYLDEILIPLLNGLGIKEIEKRDYVKEPGYRKELFELKQAKGLPLTLQGHLTTIVNEAVFLEGHVPPEIIKELFESETWKGFRSLVIYQDQMETPTTYQLWAGRGEPRTFPIDVPISKGLNFLESAPPVETTQGKILLATVLVAGFLDGINPCAFAVLLFFIAFLFTLRKNRQSILSMGAIYIVAIYVTYFLIGVGLLRAFTIGNTPHLMAKIGAWLVILLGSVHLKDYFFPNTPFSLRVPKLGENAITRWAYKGTFPAAFVLGVLVGLCTFPCTGGIYVATMGLLYSKATFYEGLVYLVLYNLMFVLPLVGILMGASSKRLAGKWLHLERSHHRSLHFFSGVVMIALGVVILIWFA